MKLFTSLGKTASGIDRQGLDVQAAPAIIGDKQISPAVRLKVDAAYRVGSFVLVAGWCTAQPDLGLCVDDQLLRVNQTSVDRHDVATHFGLPSGSQLGFVLVAECPESEVVCLTWTQHAKSGMSAPLKLETDPQAQGADPATLGPALALLALGMEPHSAQWISFVTQSPVANTACRSARGFLEAASLCEQTKEAVVVGWAVNNSSSVVWLEDEHGETYPLDGAFRRFRQDVHDAVSGDFGHASRDAGFIARVQNIKPGSKLQLKALAETGVHVLSEVTCGSLPVDPVDPVAAARWLFAVGTPMAELCKRVPMIDEPLLSPLIQVRQEIWDELPAQVRQLGKPHASPLVSIVIPLYGRVDFVEHQLIEFTRDAWLQENAEIIYVIDDPKLVEGFGAQAESLHRLYQLPFKWVWGSVSRGFSGANNLGAKYADGQYLLFLNSDAFPQQPGWLQALIDVLADNPNIGAVGPRLVFADGAIQHAGMQFLRREELGIWVNHHPNMGLDPQLDPHKALALVTGVTGACLAMRRSDFDKVKGWDTGYLIGDFEDSDLCLKLRAAGLQIAYLPTVQLTHLERQSFKMLGQDEFRTRVVIYNAVRHQTRWAGLIESVANPNC